MHLREIELIANKCVMELQFMGVEVLIVQDFDQARDLMSELGKTMGAANSPSNLLMTEANSMWVFARRYGQLIVGWGIRVDDLGSEDAQTFLPRSIEVIFGVEVTGAKFDTFGGKRWGRAAYFGDLVANTGTGLSREGRKILRLLTAYAHHRAARDLGADIAYCFLRGSDVSRGVSYGFLEASPFVWSTDRTIYADGNPEWVMQLTTENHGDLMASVSIVLTAERFAVDQKPLRPVEVSDAASG